MNTKTAAVILAILTALGGAFFGGRSSKNCPQSLVLPETAKAPVTKPLKPDTVWLERVVVHIDTVGDHDTLWRAETLLVAQDGSSRAVFEGRWPHTGDSARVWGADSITLVPFGFVSQAAPIEARMDFRRQPLLEVGGIWSWGGPDQLWATVPNIARDRRLFYTPQRIGVSFQPYQHRWGLAVSWTIL